MAHTAKRVMDKRPCVAEQDQPPEDRTHKALHLGKKRGIGRGDTVSAVLANTPAMLECHYGVPMTGAVLNTLNTRLDAPTIAFSLGHAGAHVGGGAQAIGGIGVMAHHLHPRLRVQHARTQLLRHTAQCGPLAGMVSGIGGRLIWSRPIEHRWCSSRIANPHLMPMDRGIFCTIYPRLLRSGTQAELLSLFRRYYAGQPFVRVVDHIPATKDVAYTNFCDITVRFNRDQLVVLAVIDNLIKGASGVAIQNMNLLLGLDQRTGLLGC